MRTILVLLSLLALFIFIGCEKESTVPSEPATQINASDRTVRVYLGLTIGDYEGGSTIGLPGCCRVWGSNDPLDNDPDPTQDGWWVVGYVEWDEDDPNPYYVPGWVNTGAYFIWKGYNAANNEFEAETPYFERHAVGTGNPVWLYDTCIFGPS